MNTDGTSPKISNPDPDQQAIMCENRASVTVNCEGEKDTVVACDSNMVPGGSKDIEKIPDLKMEVRVSTEFTEENSSANDNEGGNSAQILSGDDLEVLKRSKLETISQYMSLVENPKNHSMMLKEDTITGFLVLCLGDDIPEIVESSFEVFLALSKHADNLPVLKNLNYMMDALRCVASNKHLKESVRNDARNIIAGLKSFSSIKEQCPLSELSESMKNVMASATSNSCTSENATACKDMAKKSADLNTTMSTMKRKNKGRETILFLENGVIQQKTERARVTQVLITVPGIISVTYDLKKNFCIVRGKRHVASEDFGRAVASLGLSNVYLVRKNENKEEVKIPIVANDQENLMYPAYPEEQENDEIDDSTAVARKDQLPADDASFFKSAKNFIKRSFYW